MGFSDTTTRKLRAKLNGDNIRTREWNGKTLSYIEGWHALSEANRIFGFDGWHRETVDLRCIVETGPRAQSPHCAYIAKVRISVQAGEDQVIREGTGAGYSAAGSLAEAHALAAKEAETDATKRALATFGNPFGLALYDRAQKGVRRAKAPAAKPALWEVRDRAGTVTGKYADPMTCATSLIGAFEEAGTLEALQSLWTHNQDVIGKLQDVLSSDDHKANGKKPQNGSNGNGVQSDELDLLAAYQARYTHLRDTRANNSRDPENADREQPSAETPLDSSSSQPDGASEDGEVQEPAEVPEPTGAIDKSMLAIPTPKRIRAPEHLKWVATLPCLICQRRPSDAHHLKHVQPNAMGRKPGDQWVVPLCRIHHRALHDAGNEETWWESQKLNPVTVAEELWAGHMGRSAVHTQNEGQAL